MFDLVTDGSFPVPIKLNVTGPMRGLLPRFLHPPGLILSCLEELTDVRFEQSGSFICMFCSDVRNPTVCHL